MKYVRVLLAVLPELEKLVPFSGLLFENMFDFLQLDTLLSQPFCTTECIIGIGVRHF